MKTRLYNARILTMADSFNVIENGEIGIEDGRILYVGEGDGNSTVWDEEIDIKGNLLMPGFKDAHTHSGMTCLRSMADDLPLDRWLKEQIFPREAKLSGEDIYECTRLAILEYLSSGITAVFDMYLTPYTVADAMEDCGMRCVQVGATTDLAKQEEYFNKLNNRSPLTGYMFGYHAEYTFSEDILKELSLLSHKYKSPVFGHNSETASEVEGCIERHGCTPTEFADSLGLFDFGGGGYHCVYLSENDKRIFKDRGIWAVLNPGSNVKLASGIADTQSLLDCGIKLAIGTDGPASNNCLDMFREMFLVTGLSKLKNSDASSVDALKVLYMATAGGAGAMGLNDCDVLAPGKRADIIEIDLQSPNMQPFNNIPKNIVYSGSKSNIKMTMINGVIRYRDGVYHVGEDPSFIYDRVQKIAERIR